MRLKTKAALFSFLAFVASNLALSAADPVVSKVQAFQRSGTQLVDIIYELADPDSATLTVTVAVSDNAGATYAVPATSFTGDIGINKVVPGTNKMITWDAGKDWPNKFSPNMRFRVTAQDSAPAPTGMVLIPAGSFTMGDTFNDSTSSSGERPVHTVYVSAFFMDKTEVTKALWDEVRTWAVAHGYSFDNVGSGKAANHPVQKVNWYDVVKWCNARSQKEGRVPAYYTDAGQKNIYKTGQVSVQNGWVKWNVGYRLPTEAEWEKAARGGTSGHRFPWSNVNSITHSQANYYSSSSYAYDISSTRGYHPSYQSGTSPVGSFPAGVNGYGLYDMAGNLWEWCWDWWDGSYYSSSPGSDPRGPASGSGSLRVLRGGGWYGYAFYCRVASRNSSWPGLVGYDYLGFRSVLPSGQ